MESRAPALRRPLGERLVAWIVLGPLGHLWSGVADVAVLLARWVASRPPPD